MSVSTDRNAASLVDTVIKFDTMLKNLLKFASVSHAENAVLVPFVPITKERVVDVGL